MIMLIAASMLSGAVGGMGIGGGVVLIPVLTSFFGIGQREAQYINLLYFIPVAVAALIVHGRAGRLAVKAAVPMIIGGIGGAVAGSAIAMAVEVNVLRKLFGIFLFAVGLWQLLPGGRTS